MIWERDYMRRRESIAPAAAPSCEVPPVIPQYCGPRNRTEAKLQPWVQLKRKVTGTLIGAAACTLAISVAAAASAVHLKQVHAVEQEHALKLKLESLDWGTVAKSPAPEPARGSIDYLMPDPAYTGTSDGPGMVVCGPSY